MAPSTSTPNIGQSISQGERGIHQFEQSGSNYLLPRFRAQRPTPIVNLGATSLPNQTATPDIIRQTYALTRLDKQIEQENDPAQRAVLQQQRDELGASTNAGMTLEQYQGAAAQANLVNAYASHPGSFQPPAKTSTTKVPTTRVAPIDPQWKATGAELNNTWKLAAADQQRTQKEYDKATDAPTKAALKERLDAANNATNAAQAALISHNKTGPGGNEPLNDTSLSSELAANGEYSPAEQARDASAPVVDPSAASVTEVPESPATPIKAKGDSETYAPAKPFDTTAAPSGSITDDQVAKGDAYHDYLGRNGIDPSGSARNSWPEANGASNPKNYVSAGGATSFNPLNSADAGARQAQTLGIQDRSTDPSVNPVLGIQRGASDRIATGDARVTQNEAQYQRMLEATRNSVAAQAYPGVIQSPAATTPPVSATTPAAPVAPPVTPVADNSSAHLTPGTTYAHVNIGQPSAVPATAAPVAAPQAAANLQTYVPPDASGNHPSFPGVKMNPVATMGPQGYGHYPVPTPAGPPNQ